MATLRPEDPPRMKSAGAGAPVSGWFTSPRKARGTRCAVTISYDTGSLAGVLLSVVGGQPDFTQNFVGLLVDPAEAFTSITIVLNDNLSGFQDFDEVIFSQPAAVPEPGTLALLGIGIAALLCAKAGQGGRSPRGAASRQRRGPCPG